jgi:hypothetical protein
MAPLSHLVTGHWRWYLENSAAKMRSGRNMLNVILVGLTIQRCRKIKRDWGIFQAATLFQSAALLSCTRAIPSRQDLSCGQIHWQEWVSKCCCVQVAKQFKLDALMTFTPWAECFLQNADGNQCFAIWTAGPLDRQDELPHHPQSKSLWP